MTQSLVFEVTAASFQKDVIDRSRQVPILLDFWAEWCAPCKTLGPVLVKVANAYGGAFLLGKVDSDREQDLAYAFQVTSIPCVVLLQGGRPVDAFTGIVSEKDLRAFLTQGGVTPRAAEPEAPAAADPKSPEALFTQAKRAVQAGEFATTRAALAEIPDDHDLANARQRVLDGLPWLEIDLAREASPAARELERARRAFTSGELETAMAAILGAVEIDKGFLSGLPRKAMLLCFELLGPDNEHSESFRRRLATALY